MMDISLTKYIFAAICAATPVLALTLCKSSKLDHIPSVGYPSQLGSYISAFKYVKNAADILQKGYAKHKGMPFKVPTLNGWIVIVGHNHLQDIMKSADDELSFIEAASDVIKSDYLIGPEIKSNPHHISVARTYLARNVGLYYPSIKDEVHTAFEELLDLKDNVWKSVPAVKTMREIVCRVSNRIFVGLPLCRDPDWIDLNSRFAVDFCQPLHVHVFTRVVSKLLPNTAAGIKRAMNLLDPIIKERLECMREHGEEWSDKPGDILQWFMDKKQECTSRQLTVNMIATNFASLHQSTNLSAQALYNLAAYPQYVGPLREEVEAVIKQHGWTREAIVLMRKVDSFLAETLRLEGTSTASIQRKAMRDLTLSDGTFIPKGTHLFVPTHLFHHNGAVYEDPDVFDPFRFSQGCEDGNAIAKHQMVEATRDYLPFGCGKHVCPGRFLAANELKTMLAHILTSYDVKFEDRVSRPDNIHWELQILPDPTVRVMFRRRAHN
ncbi:cytochrome P450 [Pisolithus marmoratus]|nr:cytochrome P450 [Pisolithus marmoratus]